MQYLQSQVNISKFGCTIREERVGWCVSLFPLCSGVLPQGGQAASEDWGGVGAEPDQMGRMKEEGSVYECMSVCMPRVTKKTKYE